jgi:hypothetical protein
LECGKASCEGCPMNCANLTEAQKKELAKEMLKMALARMTPKQRKAFSRKMHVMAYQMELTKKLAEHKKLFSFLSMPIFPIIYLMNIARVYHLKKQYLKQVEVLTKNLKMLKELSKKSRNIISPERKKKEKKSEEKAYIL